VITLLFIFIVVLLFGAVLGQRFKVLILLPAMSLTLICTITAGVARAQDGWSIALEAVCVTSALQIGYLVGTSIRWFLAADRPAHPPLRWAGSANPADARLPLPRRAADGGHSSG
jgi:hypothetical protein